MGLLKAQVPLILSLLLLVGCGTTTHAKVAESNPPHVAADAKTQTPRTPQCALYGVIIAIGLLQRDHGPWPGIVQLRRGWAAIPPEAQRATRSFAADPSSQIAARYTSLLKTIDQATKALHRGDSNAFRKLIDGARPAVAAASSAAHHAHLQCTIVSTDRTSTLTFGG
jgi:hypothetical protein